MSTSELERASFERPGVSHQLLANHALWVCFLNQEGYETFARGSFTGKDIVATAGQNVPKNLEVSTVQYWEGQAQQTVLPTGHHEDGTTIYQTVEMLVESGELPELVAQSLAKRLNRQPFRNNPDLAIYPLLQLLPPKQS